MCQHGDGKGRCHARAGGDEVAGVQALGVVGRLRGAIGTNLPEQMPFGDVEEEVADDPDEGDAHQQAVPWLGGALKVEDKQQGRAAKDDGVEEGRAA